MPSAHPVEVMVGTTMACTSCVWMALLRDLCQLQTGRGPLSEFLRTLRRDLEDGSGRLLELHLL